MAFKPLYIALVALTLAGCAPNGEKGISPAESALATCQTYATTLSTLADFRAAGKLGDGAVKVVDQTIAYVGPYCKGQAPDVNASVKDVAIDAGVRVLQSVLISVVGG